MEIHVNSKFLITPIYDIYWYFAAERQKVYFSRLLGESPPWTEDPIINQYKFTNTYRAADRVTQYLLSTIILPDVKRGVSSTEKIFRILLFKLFNKISTWELLKDELGDISLNAFSYDRFDNILSNALRDSKTIYSAAYIMASGKNVFGHKRKHRNHLKLLEYMVETAIDYKIRRCQTMAELYHTMLSYPSIGTFLAYQFAIDINYSDITDFSEEEFVIAGPGARDGIAKCFADKGNYTDEDVIRFMMDNQKKEFNRLEIDFSDLFGRSLKLIDCQNLFCEVGKYARVSHPHILDRSKRTKIKQIFRQTGPSPIPHFPEKWGLLDGVSRFLIQNKNQYSAFIDRESQL